MDHCTIFAQKINEDCQKYRFISNEVIDSVPGIREISKQGILFLDNQMKEWKNEHAAQGMASKRKAQKTNEAVMEEANEAALEMEALEEAISIKEQKRREHLILLSSKTYWNGLGMKDGYMVEIEKVLPKFHENLKKDGEPLPTTKSKMKPLLSNFLDKLKEMVGSDNDKVLCVCDGQTNFSRLDKWQRLEIYVDVSGSSQLVKKEKNERSLLELMSAMGTKISKKYEYDKVSMHIDENGIVTGEGEEEVENTGDTGADVDTNNAGSG